MGFRIPRRLRLLSRLRERESGQSLIEVSLMLPVVFMMTFGLINFCLLLFSMGNANFASRAALRYATLHSSTSYTATTQAGLNNVVAPYIYAYPSNNYSAACNNGNTNCLSFSYSTPGISPGTNTVGSTVNITLTITYPFSVLGITLAPITYTSTARGIVLQ